MSEDGAANTAENTVGPTTDGATTPTADSSDPNASQNASGSLDATDPTEAATLTEKFYEFAGFLEQGGPAIWAISALSVITLGLILWKFWRFTVSGIWRKSRAETAVQLWQSGRDNEAFEVASSGRGIRARLATTAMECSIDSWTEADAREETVRNAKNLLAEARSGLRALELIATVAPLLGLLGTVLGMIAAFQTLQASGARADPSALAGGIWEALLTTAAGMAVAIPASAALTWFESVTDKLRLDLEDIATRIFARPTVQNYAHAAE